MFNVIWLHLGFTSEHSWTKRFFEWRDSNAHVCWLWTHCQFVWQFTWTLEVKGVIYTFNCFNKHIALTLNGENYIIYTDHGEWSTFKKNLFKSLITILIPNPSFSLPLQMAIALGLLYLQVKFAFVAGLVVIILLIPGTSRISHASIWWRMNLV